MKVIHFYFGLKRHEEKEESADGDSQGLIEADNVNVNMAASND